MKLLFDRKQVSFELTLSEIIEFQNFLKLHLFESETVPYVTTNSADLLIKNWGEIETELKDISIKLGIPESLKRELSPLGELLIHITRTDDIFITQCNITTHQAGMSDFLMSLIDTSLRRASYAVRAQERVSRLSKATQKPLFKIKIVNKTYTIMEELDSSGNKITSVQFIPEDKSKVPLVERIGTAYAVAGYEGFMSVGMKEDFKNLDISTPEKEWDLIISKKIVPIYKLGKGMDSSVEQSCMLIEDILAYNKIDKKFTKSNLIII